jgi:hypothetical protein
MNDTIHVTSHTVEGANQEREQNQLRCKWSKSDNTKAKISYYCYDIHSRNSQENLLLKHSTMWRLLLWEVSSPLSKLQGKKKK